MKREEASTYRKKLFALFDRLNGDRTQLSEETMRKTGGEASGNLSNTPVHLADLGTDNFEEEVSLGPMENQGEILTEIREAMNRIDEGTFGRCEECGQEIAPERLGAVPYARHCINCAQRLQEEAR